MKYKAEIQIILIINTRGAINVYRFKDMLSMHYFDKVKWNYIHHFKCVPFVTMGTMFWHPLYDLSSQINNTPFFFLVNNFHLY